MRESVYSFHTFVDRETVIKYINFFLLPYLIVIISSRVPKVTNVIDDPSQYTDLSDTGRAESTICSRFRIDKAIMPFLLNNFLKHFKYVAFRSYKNLKQDHNWKNFFHFSKVIDEITHF